ncbi:putative bifunctional diguanylate cyclase/phosphodiesterase [Roseovarius aestuariivivens]|uniref:putative bifunctional diguanylate cyclase/phosphodiesterase n=1 Tax=Roseovarius aestuariivivens TaxID=1888910 RepID=UPI001081B37C|nr:EAL domain-containing protein [Roseovarius aestuariivivens]
MPDGSDITGQRPSAPPCGRGTGAFCLQLLLRGRDALVVQDLDGRVRWMNPAAEAMFGWQLNEVAGQRGVTRVQPDEEAGTPEQLDNFRYDTDSTIFERYVIARQKRRDGSLFWNQQSFTLIERPAPCASCAAEGPDVATMPEEMVAISCRDVTEQIETERKLRATKVELQHAAHHDDLTGLANRKRLTAYLQSDLAKHALARRELGVLQLDLDKFKEINDTLGHGAGDATLVHVARALRAASGTRDLACRTGGDEFLLVCQRVGTQAALLSRAERILRAVNQPLRWRDQSIRIGCSIGASLAETGVSRGETLITQADQALYAAKERGRGQIVSYAPELGRAQTDRNQLARDIRTALAEEAFEIHLQPQMHLQRGRITGCEALLRWNHPKLGQLSPGEFLAVARRAGVLAELDYQALNLSLDALVRLREAGFPELGLAINVSAEILADANYPGLLDWAVQSRGLSAAALCVEITETAIMERADCAVSQAVERLKRLGAKVALDDFGTGYAGLAHMSAIEIDAIKLDRSLVARLPEDARARDIVRAVIALCRRLGTNVVAEGVERPVQVEVLRAAKCPMIQGFGLARPMPVAAMIDWLKTHGAAPERLLARAPGAARQDWHG